MANFTARMPYGGLRGFSLSASSSSNGVSPHMDSARQTGAGGGPVILELPLDKMRRPLMRTRANDPNKVQELMDSIRRIGLQVPIDVLEVDGVYYGLFPDADSLSSLIICIEALQHLATVKVVDLLYFVVPRASPAVIGMKLISASASLPSVAKFTRSLIVGSRLDLDLDQLGSSTEMMPGRYRSQLKQMKSRSRTTGGDVAGSDLLESGRHVTVCGYLTV